MSTQIQDLVRRLTITFPRLLTLPEIEKFVDFLSRGYGSKVNCLLMHDTMKEKQFSFYLRML